LLEEHFPEIQIGPLVYLSVLIPLEVKYFDGLSGFAQRIMGQTKIIESIQTQQSTFSLQQRSLDREGGVPAIMAFCQAKHFSTDATLRRSA